MYLITPALCINYYNNDFHVTYSSYCLNAVLNMSTKFLLINFGVIGQRRPPPRGNTQNNAGGVGNGPPTRNPLTNSGGFTRAPDLNDSPLGNRNSSQSGTLPGRPTGGPSGRPSNRPTGGPSDGPTGGLTGGPSGDPTVPSGCLKPFPVELVSSMLGGPNLTVAEENDDVHRLWENLTFVDSRYLDTST
ncbi:hypothetical protein EB796_021587 [Bugula neritina]|uniref:Uncharacterized protein n=1 Tax=Bugula neritina TaxID=10212 RepID=A0A7J7J1P2_BUGNE|nr:hypothetical protein EB796_021587 [Bugula neritina]